MKRASILLLSLIVWAVAPIACQKSSPTAAPSASSKAQPGQDSRSTPQSPAGPMEASGTPDFVITATNIGSFNYGDATFQIWPSAFNVPGKPTLWQFRYDPLFVPEIDEQTKALNLTSVKFGAEWKVRLPIVLDNRKSRILAFEGVKGAFPAEASSIQDHSVFVLPIKRIKIEVPDLITIAPTARLGNDVVQYSRPPDHLTVEFLCPDEATVKQLMEHLPNATIKYTLSFSARHPKRTVIQLRMKDLQKTTFYEKLNGIPQKDGLVYVHRDQAKELLRNAVREIGLDIVTEDEGRVNNAIYTDLINMWSKKADEESLDFVKSVRQNVYNSQDLEPTVMRKKLEKMFTADKTIGKDQWKHSGDFETKGSVGIPEIFSGSAEMRGAFSTEGLKEFLREHGLQTELNWEGNEIIPRAISLQAVNMGQFGSDKTFTETSTYLPGEFKQQQAGELSLYEALAHKQVTPSLGTRVADLEKTVGELQILREEKLIVAVVLPGFPDDKKKALEAREKEWKVLEANGMQTVYFTPQKAQRIVASWWVPWSEIGNIEQHHDIHVRHKGNTVEMDATNPRVRYNPGNERHQTPFTIELHALYVGQSSDGSDLSK